MTLNAGYAYRTPIQRGGQTVLAFLAGQFAHSDVPTWAARLAAGEVELDGVWARGPEVLRAGQVLVWHRPPWPEEGVLLDYGVLYEDDSLLAVDKPSGLPTLPGGGFLEHTLLAQVRQKFPGASPLHRLGRGTSGVVLFARNAQAGAALSRAWREHAVSKTYRALVAGVVEPDFLTVTAPIGPVTHPRLGTVHAATPGGRASHSELRVVERRPVDSGVGSTLLDVDILTGRPHQIRIHTAFAGHPLLGDPLYALGGGILPELPGLPGDLGYGLHAWRLSFTHPRTGEMVTVGAPLPGALARTGETGQDTECE